MGARSNAVPNTGTTGEFFARLQAELDRTVNGKNYVSGPPVGNPRPASEVLSQNFTPGVGAQAKTSK